MPSVLELAARNLMDTIPQEHRDTPEYIALAHAVNRQAAIDQLRSLCNATIKQINTGQGVNTPGFRTINALLRAGDKVFAET